MSDCKYIVVSISEESGDRALYYEKSIGRSRLYRSGYPEPYFPNLALKTYKTKKGAQKDCDYINNYYGDNFKVIELKNNQQ